jgi:hypothetical protein
MKAQTFFIPALGLSALAAMVLAPAPLKGEPAMADDPAVTAALTEAAAQQTVIVENQAKIDAKLAAIGENIRLTRIFVSRGGGKTP